MSYKYINFLLFSSLSKLNNSLSLVGDITTTVKETAQVFVTIKEIDRDIKNIDADLQKFMKNADANLEKFKMSANLVGKEIDSLSTRLDKILDKALGINTNTENEQEIKIRTELLAKVDKWSDIMSSILMKLLGV